MAKNGSGKASGKLDFLDYEARIKRLKSVLDQKQMGDALVFFNALVQNRNAYLNDPSAKNRADWESAKDGLDKSLAVLEETYFPTEPMFDNILAVVKSLQDQGYKVQKSKVYDDKKKGLIFVQPDGRVRESDVLAYVARCDLQKKITPGEVSGIQAEKAEKEVEKLVAQIEKMRFDLEKDMDRYMLKDDFAAEVAARAVVLEANLKNLFRTRMVDVVTMVDGDQKKTRAALDFMLSVFDEFLNEYSSVDTFQVRAI